MLSRGDALEAWITEAAASGLEALARFAQGLRDDLAAVKAGRTLPWSNGPVEGHVNRLKMLKRQGYGRAGVGLLRQRVMPAVSTQPWHGLPCSSLPYSHRPERLSACDEGSPWWEAGASSDSSSPAGEQARHLSPKARKSEDALASFAPIRVSYTLRPARSKAGVLRSRMPESGTSGSGGNRRG